MRDLVLDLLRRRDYVPANAGELLESLGMTRRQARKLRRELDELERRGEIARIKGDRWVLPEEADLVPGRIQITRRGRGFLLPDEPGLGEIGIRPADTGTALNDDRVLVRRDVRPQGKRRGKEEEQTDSGVVVRVLERWRTRFVGTLKQDGSILRVVPDDPRMVHDIVVPPPRDVGRKARPGDKVVVELGRWDSPHASPPGTITEVLGPPTAEGVDMLGVLRQYHLPMRFPRKVLQEVRRFGTEVRRRDREGRKDCRKAPVVTIDPVDAKDFDDAFSLERTGSKRWKLCVHIADVSHYVEPGTALDAEARERGNSTYLVDRVVPMLPEALSNELCSLKPEVERLSKCVEFLIEDDGTVQRSQCYPAVIRSQRRYSYEEALEVLRDRKGDELDQMLKQANRLAQKIRKRRFKAGSLELDFPESKIRLDDRGRVERIDVLENDESHQLVEELMLLANEAVARRLDKQKRPALYRVHEPPAPDRLAAYRDEVLDHGITCGRLDKPGEVQKLLKRLDDEPSGPALKIGLLKSLSRARYAVEPLGHYGLAKDHYTHFTSPIRRYADLVVHRVLFDELEEDEAVMKETADHVSATERNSSDAERDSKAVKLQAYLMAQLESGKRERYTALVTDVRNFGFFVDVSDLGTSGLVALSSLDDDFYEFDAQKLRVRGRRTRRIIRIGDRIEVEIAKVDTEQKRLDFRLAPSESSGRRGKSGDRGRSKSRSRGEDRKRVAAAKETEGKKGSKRTTGQKARAAKGKSSGGTKSTRKKSAERKASTREEESPKPKRGRKQKAAPKAAPKAKRDQKKTAPKPKRERKKASTRTEKASESKPSTGRKRRRGGKASTDSKPTARKSSSDRERGSSRTKRVRRKRSSE